MIYSCLVDADFLDTEYFMKKWAGGTTIRSKYEHSIEKVRKSHFRLVEK